MNPCRAGRCRIGDGRVLRWRRAVPAPLVQATGVQAEYIRHGMNYDVWLNNVKRLLAEPKVEGFSVMMTINALCLGTMTDLMDDMLALRDEFGWDQKPFLSLNLKKRQ